MPHIFIGRWLRGFGTFMNLTTQFMDKSEETLLRERILVFWEKYGLQATMDAFEVKRSTLFLWKKRNREGKLAPRSRRPRNVRKPTTSSTIIDQVNLYRRAFPFLGKDKIAQVLLQKGYPVSASTVGRIIHRNHLPSAPRQHVARTKKHKARLPKDYDIKNPGDLVGMDTVVIQDRGRKKYIITAVDYLSRTAVARAYSSPSSQHAKDLLTRVRIALGRDIQAVNTDNGSEFRGEYEKACQSLKIDHFYTYPRSPKMNPLAERFNRTIQEEAKFPLFTEPLSTWNNFIAHYIMIYNFFRPHYALEYRTPADVLLNSSQSNMLWTHT